MALYCYFLNNQAMPEGYSQSNPFQRERKTLGNTVEKLRKKRNMTQEILAEKTHKCFLSS